MKDIVDNRRKLGLGHKARLFLLSLKENGVVWTVLLAIYYVCSAVGERAFSVMQSMKKERGLPGTSSASMNREIWRAWDWSAGGEEWSPSPEWKASLVRCVLDRHVPKGGHILEIGPGAGRWTERLIELGDKLTAVDISDTCVKLCQEKFKDQAKASFMVGSGRDLAGVPDGVVNTLWSFDVFVHINKAEVANYVREFRRVMHPGAVGIVHHGKQAGVHGGWRSDLTAQEFKELLEAAGFTVDSQFETWEENSERHQVGLYEDVVTVFRA